jgi:hypothetical protein
VLAFSWKGARGLPQTALERHETVPFLCRLSAEGRVMVNQEIVLILKHPADVRWLDLPPLEIDFRVFDADHDPGCATVTVAVTAVMTTVATTGTTTVLLLSRV